MANITVKANNGTTDVVLTSLVPSSGDKNPARWRVEDALTAVGNRRTLTVMAEPTNSNARRVTSRFNYPVVRQVNGVDTLIGRIPLEISGVYGQQYTQGEIDEAVSQGLNAFASTLVRDSFKSTYAPS
jgi:hypothetical protein